MPILGGNNDVKIKISTEADSKGIDEIDKKLASFSKNATSASKKFTTVFAGAVAGLGALFTKSTLTAARTETLGIAMEAVAKSTGTSMEVLKEQEAILRKQGITTQEARASLTRFMQSQLDVADASKIARVAQDLAVIAGENSSETTARLTDAIATMNPMLLRQVGIVKNSKEIFDAYGSAVGKSGDELTDVERKQALVNTILLEGEKVAGTYEASMTTAGKKMGSLARYFEEAHNAIGNVFLPVFGQLVDGLTEFLKKITPENIERFFKVLQDNTPIVGAIAGAIFAMMIPALIAMAAGVWAVVAPLIPFAIAGAAVGFMIAKVVEAMGGWEEIMNKITPILNFLGEIFRNIILPELKKVWDQVANELIPALRELWRVVEPVLIPVLKVLAVLLGVALLDAIMIFIKGIQAVIAIITQWVNNVKNAVEMVFGFFKWLFNVLVGHSLIPDLINEIVDWFKKLPSLITDGLKNLYTAITEPFTKAFNKVKEMAGEVWESLKKLNPFERQSPSLVDNVTRGVAIIKDQFASLKKLEFPTASSLVSPTLSPIVNMPNFEAPRRQQQTYSPVFNVNQNNNIYSPADLDMMMREIAYSIQR